MVDIKYANAYTEVLEILKYISIEDYNKIPKSRIELFKINANNNYIFTYNPDKTLDEQNVSKIAKGIIAILFRDYWATDMQREKIIAKQNYDRQKLEEENRKKYNPDNLFKKKEIKEIQKEKIVALTEFKESNFFKKILNKFISFFS